MIVLTRFAVTDDQVDDFCRRAEDAVAVLSTREGFLTADLGRNVDEPSLFTVTTRWRDVGSYRRALQGTESKLVVVPLLSLALDEPSAYEDVALVGENQARGSGPHPLAWDR